jgi:uncharacterized protein (DUF3084 family)
VGRLPARAPAFRATRSVFRAATPLFQEPALFSWQLRRLLEKLDQLSEQRRQLFKKLGQLSEQQRRLFKKLDQLSEKRRRFPKNGRFF